MSGPGLDPRVLDRIEAVVAGRAGPGGQSASLDAARDLVAQARTSARDVLASVHQRLLLRGGAPRLAGLLGGILKETAETAAVDALVLMLRDRDARTRDAAATTLKDHIRGPTVAARLAQWAAQPRGWSMAARQLAWALLDEARWQPANPDEVRLLVVAARQPEPDSAPARRLLYRALRGGDFLTTAVEAFGPDETSRAVLMRIAAEVGGEVAAAARDRLLRLAGIDTTDRSRWAELIDVPAEITRLSSESAVERRESAVLLGTFAASVARPALEAIVRGEDGRPLAPEAHEAMVAVLDALAAVGDLGSLKVFLALERGSNSVPRAKRAVDALARRLGEPAAVLAREALTHGDSAGPLVFRAFGAASGAPAIPLLASFLHENAAHAVAALGATRAAAALPEILRTARSNIGTGFSNADILHSGADALAEVLTHDAAAASEDDLFSVAGLQDTVVMTGSRGMSNAVRIQYAHARARAEAELQRRGRPVPIAKGLRAILRAPLTESATAAAPASPEPCPVRLRAVEGCPDCGEPLVRQGRRPGAYTVACHQGHGREVMAEYATLAFDEPPPDVSFAAHFEHCAGEALPFAVPPRAGPLALERRGSEWVATQVGTPEADVPSPEIERGQFAPAPWRCRPDRHGAFLAGFAPAGGATAFRVLDIRPDRMIFLSTPFGSVYAEEGDLARQAPDVVRLGRIYAALDRALRGGVAHVHAVHNHDRGYCGLTLADGRIIHHEGRLLVADAKELWTPRLAPVPCPRCRGQAPANEVPEGTTAINAPVEVPYRCAVCGHTFRAPWPPRTASSPRPPER